MQTMITFRSSRFQVEPGEDEETNPGLYGKSLAAWLQARLGEQGIGAPEPIIAEDFGWLVVISRKPTFLWLACCNQADPVESGGGIGEWAVIVSADPTIVQRLTGGKAIAEAVDAVAAKVEKILKADPQISEVRQEKR